MDQRVYRLFFALSGISRISVCFFGRGSDHVAIPTFLGGFLVLHRLRRGIQQEADLGLLSVFSFSPSCPF